MRAKFLPPNLIQDSHTTTSQKLTLIRSFFAERTPKGEVASVIFDLIDEVKDEVKEKPVVPDYNLSLEKLVRLMGEIFTTSEEVYSPATGSTYRYEKIRIIKVVRRITNWGLKESKEYVERIMEG